MDGQTFLKPLPKALAVMAITLIVAGLVGGVLSDVDEVDGDTHGTSSSPLSSLSTTAFEAYGNTYYVKVGGSVRISNTDLVVSISSGSGYGLSNSTSGVSGTLTKAGTITLLVVDEMDEPIAKVTIIAVSVSTSTTYKLTYNANGGSGAPSQQSGTSSTGSYTFTVSSTTPTKSGYTFLGWSTSSSASSASYSAGSKFTASSITTTLYAVWKVNSTTYTLYYNANGGSGAPSSQSGTSSTGSYTFTVSSTTPTKSGYTFLGWSTSSSASSASYTSGSSYKVSSTSATLYAVWKQNEYTSTLYYSASGASNVPSTQTYTGTATTDHAFTISSSKPAKDGYVFMGWSTTNGATSASYQPGNSISVSYNGSKTLYAVWAQNLSITSSPSTAAIKGTEYAYDVTANISGCTVTVSGASWLSVSGMKISGTPTTTGTFNVTVTISKTGCIDDIQTFSIYVWPALEFTTTPTATGIFAYVG